MQVPTSFGPSLIVQWVGVPTAASHTYTFNGLRQNGTGTLTFSGDPTFPTFVLIEDLGPAL